MDSSAPDVAAPKYRETLTWTAGQRSGFASAGHPPPAHTRHISLPSDKPETISEIQGTEAPPPSEAGKSVFTISHQILGHWCLSIWCQGWTTRWAASPELRAHYPPRHTDFRDSLPDDMRTAYETYNPFVKDGAWTFGLLEMWFPRAKAVKHSVHMPCWDSYKINPFKWRGIVLGRTMRECYWAGFRQMRWTRAVYAAGLGSEYVYPVQGVGHHGYKSELKALCWLYCCMQCLFGCGIGQVFSLCGNFGCNFAACYSCHARERMRRKWSLPPIFGLPPGIDDCLVHFFCFYCSSHQELRELAVRGVDGPGMHMFDLVPDSYKHIEGAQAAIDARRVLVEHMVSKPPKILTAREKKVKEAKKEVDVTTIAPSEGSEASEQFGWMQYKAPKVQEMARYGPSARIVTASSLTRAHSF